MTTLLDIDLIRLDGGTQSRDALNTDAIAEYAEKMRAGVQFRPVIVYYDGESYWLADGFHRIKAARAAGLRQFETDVQQGTRREAVLYSVGANDDHGIRRTNADKRRAVLNLLQDNEWKAWSNAEIARRCNVSHKLVNELRSLEPGPSERTYTTRHGTTATMNTANIGKSPSVPHVEPGPLPPRPPVVESWTPPPEPSHEVRVFDANGERLAVGSRVTSPVGKAGTITALNYTGVTVALDAGPTLDFDPRKLTKVGAGEAAVEFIQTGRVALGLAQAIQADVDAILATPAAPPVPRDDATDAAIAAAAVLFPDEPILIDALAHIALFSNGKLEPYAELADDVQVLQNLLDAVRAGAGLT